MKKFTNAALVALLLSSSALASGFGTVGIQRQTGGATGAVGPAATITGTSIDSGLGISANGPIQRVSPGVYSAMTPAQQTAYLNTFSSSLAGSVPASGGGTTNFLRADGTWAAPPSGGGSVSGSSVDSGLGLTSLGAVTRTGPSSYGISKIGPLTSLSGLSSASELDAWGDSNTVGLYNTPVTVAYSYLLGYGMGLATTNRGVSSDMSCDFNNHVFALSNPPLTHAPLSTAMIGTNDANIKGTGAYEAIYTACHLPALAWLGIAQDYKVNAQASTVTQSGFTADTTFQSGIGMVSTLAGSTMTIPITSYGGAIYLWYRVIDGGTGTFNLSVDGGTPQTVNAFTSPAIATGNGATQAIAMVRLTGFASGAHSLGITAGAGTVEIWGAGTTPPSGQAYYQGPKVFSAGVTKQLTDQNSAASLAYNNDATADVALLQGDGLNITFVDVRKYVGSTSTDMINQLHFNPTGHQHIRDAFEAAMQTTTGNSLQASSSGTQLVGPLPLVVNPVLEADDNQYLNVNGTNLTSTTLLGGGFMLYRGPGTNHKETGIDFGYNATQARYRTRFYSVAQFDWAWSTHVAGTQPTGQTSDTDLASLSSQNGCLVLGSPNACTPGAILDLSNANATGTSSFVLPGGSNSTRPTTPVAGMLRYSTNALATEAYQNGAWSTIGQAEQEISYNATSVRPGIGKFTKVPKSSTVDNFTVSATSLNCTANPSITLNECGTSASCASPATIGSVTATSIGTAFSATISNATIAAGDYVAWSMTGTCTALDINASAEIHAN